MNKPVSVYFISGFFIIIAFAVYIAAIWNYYSIYKLGMLNREYFSQHGMIDLAKFIFFGLCAIFSFMFFKLNPWGRTGLEILSYIFICFTLLSCISTLIFTQDLIELGGKSIAMGQILIIAVVSVIFGLIIVLLRSDTIRDAIQNST